MTKDDHEDPARLSHDEMIEFARGMAAYDEDERELARSHFEKVTNLSHAMRRWYEAEDARGVRDEAIDWYAIPVHPAKLFELGILAAQVDDRAAAEFLWGKVLEISDGVLDAHEVGLRQSLVMFNLGVLAKQAGDVESERSWYEKAADLGDADSMFNLGVLAKEAGDVESERSWYEKAADLGDADSMFKLGSLAKEADDVELARSWYKRAADAGNAYAPHYLGMLDAKAAEQ
jgi:tetratricopeptide (TPR) repeat protein